ncbi:ABC-ATPase domain-containing protein [Pelagicoccus sp. SDUM812003]|uniref:ABC-ATPase domain-containing protein n=1 Tax=Pelagicoccus sp. SDUM812003 TaxID=3041267 RepID=UPI002810605B|nr:ABC-ATPase domain-containing protein [Pelagicoccus sp. SDUM812003]MDQ8203213.1 ABC-ATPase domain-containing protein [Pelagicoccus sp. SDUM812003]
MTSEDLSHELRRLDGRPYPAYKDLRGRYTFSRFDLSIDRVQGDPFAAPSRLSLRIAHAVSALPPSAWSTPSRRIGSENAIAMAFAHSCRRHQSRDGSGKSGLIAIDEPEQEILARTCVQISESETIVRFAVGLPASGRRILGRAADRLLVDIVSLVAQDALDFEQPELLQSVEAFATANETGDHLRKQLGEQKLVAFIADGAILPRASGVDQRPLKDAIPFRSPASMRRVLKLPNGETIAGLGIREGVTLIVGGGYHGKSTLLNAIERGVYNHRPGDGRERVVTRADACKIRAEDGRSVASVDLSAFISDLPGGKQTSSFSTENASGSTSQAAAIIESLESGCRALLIDEDISATNFLIRDRRMQQLISADKEPITPLAQRVKGLHRQHGVSTLLVLGGSSDYFEPADAVIAMENFLPFDLTNEAKALCEHTTEETTPFPLPEDKRFAQGKSIYPYRSAPAYRGRKQAGTRPPRKNIKAHETRSLSFGTEEIDLSLLAQLVSPSQTRAIGALLEVACDESLFEQRSLIEALEAALETAHSNGWSSLPGNDLAAVRLQELAACLNRLRSLRIR